MRAGVLIVVLLIVAPTMGLSLAQEYQCPPTSPDADGPFYRPGAPVRKRVGSGYGLIGEVKSAADCSVIGNAKIEIWLAGPDGIYGDAWRATVFSRPNGRYVFSCDLPGRYGTRPPHIHLIANAPGYQELITQHYLTPGTTGAVFDLVLIPEE